MSRLTRRWMISVVTALLAAPALGMGGAESQTPAAPVMVRGSVFVGGYFYDTAFGPYPWWPEGYYRYWYVPVFDVHAVLRLKATP